MARKECDSLDEFIAEARKAVLTDPAATIESPDGTITPLLEFLANWDRQHPKNGAAN